MISIQNYIVEVSQKLKDFYNILHYKKDRGIDCFSDNLTWIVLNIYFNILREEDAFGVLNATKREELVHYINKTLKIHHEPDVETLVYGLYTIPSYNYSMGQDVVYNPMDDIAVPTNAVLDNDGTIALDNAGTTAVDNSNNL